MPNSKVAFVTIVETESDDTPSGTSTHWDSYQIEFEGEFAVHRMFNENWVAFDRVTNFERLMVLPDHADSER